MKNLREYITEANSCTVYMMIGIPGSGKSTWISNNLPKKTPVVSRDIIRVNLGLAKSVDEKIVASYKDEQKVTAEENKQIEDFASKGIDFALDDTNTGKYRKQTLNHLKNLGCKVVAVKMETPLNVCIERRKNQIPADKMEQIYKKQVEFNPNEFDKVITVK